MVVNVGNCGLRTMLSPVDNFRPEQDGYPEGFLNCAHKLTKDRVLGLGRTIWITGITGFWICRSLGTACLFMKDEKIIQREQSR